MKNKIGQIMRKTYGYWWVDGLIEIGVGLIFGILGGYNYLLITLPLNTTTSILMAFGEPAIFIACWFGYGRFVRWTKERLTYRRTGYVAYQPKDCKERKNRVALSAFLGVSMGLLVTFVGPVLLKVSSLVMVSGLLALVTLFLAIWHGVNRLLIVAAAQFLLGLWLSTTSMESGLASSLLMAAIGAVWLVSGLCAFIAYIIHTKPNQEENV